MSVNQLVIYERLKELRLLKEYKQKQVAEMMNVSSQLISKWERGYLTPSLEDIERLAQVFGCSSEYLLGHTDTLVIEHSYRCKRCGQLAIALNSSDKPSEMVTLRLCMNCYKPVAAYPDSDYSKMMRGETIELPSHYVDFTLRLSFEMHGNTAEALEAELAQQNFYNLDPNEQIKVLLNTALELSLDDGLDYTSQPTLTVARALKRIISFPNEGE